MIASIFTTIIVQPIFNLLVLIYGLLPGHNFGLAIVIFTILVRLLLWPLVKKTAQPRQSHARAAAGAQENQGGSQGRPPKRIADDDGTI